MKLGFKNQSQFTKIISLSLFSFLAFLLVLMLGKKKLGEGRRKRERQKKAEGLLSKTNLWIQIFCPTIFLNGRHIQTLCCKVSISPRITQQNTQDNSSKAKGLKYLLSVLQSLFPKQSGIILWCREAHLLCHCFAGSTSTHSCVRTRPPQRCSELPAWQTAPGLLLPNLFQLVKFAAMCPLSVLVQMIFLLIQPL